MPDSEHLLFKHTETHTVTGLGSNIECVNMGYIVPLLLSVIVIGGILLFFLRRRRMTRQVDRRSMKIKKTIAILILILIVGLLSFVFPRINKEIHSTRMLTAHEALENSLIIALSDYYRENGIYPDSLNELTDIEYCDGATPELIKDFGYSSDGDSYELSYFSTSFGEESNENIKNSDSTHKCN